MKLSLFAVVPLAGLFCQTAANPVAAAGGPLVKRQYEEIETGLNGLYASIQEHTGVINSTIANLGDGSTILERGAAAQVVSSQLSSVVSLINGATDSFRATKKRSVEDGAPLVTRQSGADAIVQILGLIFSEISGSLINIINGLGLGKKTFQHAAARTEMGSNEFPGPLLAFLNPLGTALANLLLSLRDLVDQLLILVRELLDGILEGLAGALGGFSFGF